MDGPTQSSYTTSPKMTMRHILKLPEELSELVLRHVKDSGTSKDFWNCLKTCRDWHRIGLGVHGQLDHTISTILESRYRRSGLNQEHPQSNLLHTTNFNLGGPSQLYVSELRSLTIHVRHARIAAPFAPIPGRNMFDSIVDVFHRTRKLSTFSLKFACDGWDFPHDDVPAIPQSQLARMVANLPSTVVNLEIDTAGVDVPPAAELLATDEWHLCYQLSILIGRFRHLRLRVGHVCRHILGSQQNAPVLGEAELGCGVGNPMGQKSSTTGALETFTLWAPEYEDTDAMNLLLLGNRKQLTLQNATVTMVRQDPTPNRSGEAIQHAPLGSLIWTAKCSSPGKDSIERSVHVHKMDKFHSAMVPPHHLRHCAEHDILTSSSRRQFQMGGDIYPKSDFPYIGEWILENASRWAQAGHLGPRYPAAEADSEDKPFWRKPLLWHPPTLMEYMEYKDLSIKQGSGLWACLFPACPARCESLHHLRGHQLYAHPASPHTGQFQGAHPCPSVGCDRIGYNAYVSPQQLESHLLKHHLHPCTRSR